MPVRLSLSGNSQFEEGKHERIRLSAHLRDQRLRLLGLQSRPAGQPRRGGGMGALKGHFPEIKESSGGANPRDSTHKLASHALCCWSWSR